jgi:carboxylesterase
MVECLPQNTLLHQAVDSRHGIALNEYPDNLPFLFEPRGTSKAAVLLVHGFTATPWEMRPLGEALKTAGFAALGICLPGHGTVAENLSKRSYEEWLQEVDLGYQMLAENYPRVYGVGMSTGALLLLALARHRPIEGLVLFSPFLRLRHRLAPLVGMLRHIKPYQKRKLSPDLAIHYYNRRPLNGIYQIQHLIRALRGDLKKILTPTLIFSAQGDRTIADGSAKKLFNKLGSRNKNFHQFGSEVPHVLASRENPRWEETVERTIRFLRGLELAEQAAAADGHKAP